MILLYIYNYVSAWITVFRLPEVRYTGHLAWHGMLAICLLHKTHPEVRPLGYLPVPEEARSTTLAT